MEQLANHFCPIYRSRVYLYYLQLRFRCIFTKPPNTAGIKIPERSQKPCKLRQQRFLMKNVILPPGIPRMSGTDSKSPRNLHNCGKWPGNRLNRERAPRALSHMQPAAAASRLSRGRRSGARRSPPTYYKKTGANDLPLIREHGIIQTRIRVGCARFSLTASQTEEPKRKCSRSSRTACARWRGPRTLHYRKQKHSPAAVPASSKELCSPPSPTHFLPARRRRRRCRRLPEELATCAARSTSPACSMAFWALRPPPSPAITSRSAAFHEKSRPCARENQRERERCS